MKTLHVDLGARSYPIYIGPGLLERPELIRELLPGPELVLVSNETVGPLYRKPIQQAFGLGAEAIIELPDGERFKTLETLNQVFDHLLENRFSRKTTLLALGGGVVGDMAGFAAASYQRGVPFVQIPTTLLAQVDSSVGGKTAVNHRLGKNMIGAFHQPLAVLADTNTLQTLPKREFAAGLAEVIKYGLIADAEFFAWLESNAAALCAKEPAALEHAIARSCAIKADIVARDETEQGQRALLNLGHTFGHAVEAVMQYRGILHGEAVAIGMLLAAKMSALLGALTESDVARVQALLQACELPLAPAEKLPLQSIKEAMLLDKKVVAGSLRLILLDTIGTARVTADFSEASLDATLATVFKH